MSAGYSGTPLAKKLGLKPDMAVLVVEAPHPYQDFFPTFPDAVQFIENPTAESVDFIHVFVKTHDQLKSLIPPLKPALKKDGLMWVSWPKGSSKIETDVKREPLRTFVLKQGLVDVKVCAVDADWSGLKFVYRVKDR